MEDNKIIELYWNRDENAIYETNNKYGKYCYTIANNILQSEEDSKECVNDTYLKVWNTIPPARPNIFKLFIAKITRNLAINKYEKNKAKKRNTNMDLALEELKECLPDNSLVEEESNYQDLIENLNNFLKEQSLEKRKIFLERYWNLFSIHEISEKNHLNEINVKVILHRLRKKLKEYLNERGVNV